jgi:hypothetical protein
MAQAEVAAAPEPASEPEPEAASEPATEADAETPTTTGEEEVKGQ